MTIRKVINKKNKPKPKPAYTPPPPKVKEEENPVIIKNRKKFVEYRKSIEEKIVDLMIYLNAFNAATVRSEKIMRQFLQSEDFTVIEEEGRKQLDSDMNLFMRIFFAREFALNMLNISESEALEYSIKYVLESNATSSKYSTLIDMLQRKDSKKSQPPADISALIGMVKSLSEKKSQEPPFGKL